MAEVKRKYDLRPRIQLVVQSDYELTKSSPKEKPLSKELIEAISEKSSFRSSKPNGLQHSKKSPVPLKRALSIELLVQLSLFYHHLTLDMSLVSERFPCLYLKLLKFQPIEANLLIFGSHELILQVDVINLQDDSPLIILGPLRMAEMELLPLSISHCRCRINICTTVCWTPGLLVC
nr:hypothetical protein Q903MT_gene1058 [Picea sitchensis]